MLLCCYKVFLFCFLLILKTFGNLTEQVEHDRPSTIPLSLIWATLTNISITLDYI